MVAWEYETIHGKMSVSVYDKRGILDKTHSLVVLRKPDLAGGNKQSFVPFSRVQQRVKRIVEAIVLRLEENPAG